MLKYNNSILKVNNGASTINFTRVPLIPNDMDFIYLANDFDGTQIPNKATGTTTFGPYLKQGTITKNGSGSSAYLSNGLSESNYLYKDLTTTELNTLKAIDGTYTFFIRVMQTSGGLGAIMSCRLLNDDGYIYMIRAHDNELEIHTDSQHKCGSNFSLTTDIVYKVVINGSTFKAVNLSTNDEFAFTYSTNRNMGTRMSTFNGYSGSAEGRLDRFYALAGIPRATTLTEDANIKAALMTQSIYA
jgi:hypothetical protein